MSTELDIEVARVEARKNPLNWNSVGKGVTREDIKKAVANGGELILDYSQGARKPADTGGLIAFGKHKGKTYNWVYKNDIGWMTWAFANIQGFKAKAEAANYKQS